MRKPRRRQAGEGGISEYETKAGRRFLIKFRVQREDGIRRVVLKRGFLSRRDAAAALRAEIGKAEVGEWVEPSKQRLDAYLAAWIQGQRLSPSTLSSYRKNIRLHIDPYLGGQLVARLTGSAVDAWMWTLEASGWSSRRPGRALRAHGALRAHDPAVGAERCGQAGAPRGQSDRPIYGAEPVGGPSPADEGLDRAGAGPLSRLGGRARSGPGHGAGGCSRPPECAAVRRSPCAGGTSTWRPPGLRYVAVSGW